MNSKQIEYVLAIWRCGSFSKASKELFISQPSLSQYILKLENQLGAPLFDRKTSPLQLTEAGRIYVKYASKILEYNNKIAQEIQALNNDTASHISIGASPYVAQNLLPAVISEIKKRFANISITVKEMPYEYRQKTALEGAIDFFFTFGSIGDSRIAQQTILPERILLALPPTHRFVTPETIRYQNEVAIPTLRLRNYSKDAPPYKNDFPTISLYQLRDDPFVVTRTKGHLRNVTMELFNQVGFEPKIVLESRNIDVASAMTVNGIGVSFIPETAPRFINNRTHPIYYRILEYDSVRYLRIGYAKFKELTPLQVEFISVAEQVLKSPL